MLNMIESRVDRAHLAAVGTADHLRAPPVRRRSRPASGCRRSPSRSASTRRSVIVARNQHDRHGDREGARRERGQRRRHAHGHGVRRVVSRATSTTRRSSRTSPPTGPRRRSSSTRRRANTRSTTSRRTCATCARRASTRALEAGLVAAARRGRLHGNGVARDDRVRVEVQGLAAHESLSGRTRADRARHDEAAVRLRRSRRSSAIRSPRSSCCGAWRSAAFASRS